MMGYSSSKQEIEARNLIVRPFPRAGKTATFKRLRRHPNFKWPADPIDLTDESLVRYICEACANFVSPEKHEGENDEFRCEDISNAIRSLFLPELMEQVKRLRTTPNVRNDAH